MQRFLGTVILEDASECAVSFISSASTVSAAIDEYNRTHPGREMVKCVRLHGGAREGSGRKAKYCEPGKTVRLPQTAANNIDKVFPAIIDLYHLCKYYQELAQKSPTSPRYEKVREFLKNAESCLADLKESVDAATGENSSS